MPNRVQLGVETLRADAAALFSFVDSICQFSVDRDSPAYLDPSKEFFKYVRDLGDATKAYLNVFSEKAPRDPSSRRFVLRGLSSTNSSNLLSTRTPWACLIRSLRL
jgi:hypothetical protein